MTSFIHPTSSAPEPLAHRSRQSIPLAALCMVLSSAFLVTLAVLVRQASAQATSMQAVLYRSLFSFLPLWGWLQVKEIPVRSARWLLLSLRGLLGFLALSCYFYGVTHIELANALALQQLSPIFVAFLSVLLLGERPSSSHWFLAGLCLIGALLVIQPNRGLVALPAVVALGAAVLSSGAYVTVRALTRTEPSLRIVLWFSGVATLLALPVVVPSWRWLSWDNNLMLVAAGLLAVPAQGFMTAAYARAEAHITSAFSYINVPFAYLSGLIIWGEQPDPLSLGGIGLIVTGGVLLVLSMRAPGRRPVGRP